MKKGIDFDLLDSSTLTLNWAPGVVLWKPQRPMRTVLISSQFHCPRPPWLVCVPDQNRHYAGYYAPFSVPFDLNFWKLRYTHPKKMPVKKYPYAPTLVYFADKHLWQSRQRSRGAGVFSPSPQPKFGEGMQSPPTLWCWKTVLPMYLTSATSGRIFSARRQLKSYLRGTMKQDPPEHLPTDPLSQIDYGHNRQWRLQRG